MNVIALTGRAVRNPEIKYTPSGKPVANGTIAVQRKYKNEQGNYEADFIDFVAWGKAGELIANHIKKGDLFAISGELQTRTWEKQDGSKQKISEVNVNQFDFPQKKKENNQNGEPYQGSEPPPY